jgi:hypothetical protein
MFKQTFNPDGTVSGIGKLEDSGAYIWFSIENEAYLKWLEEGNTPLPAENT